MLPNFLQSSYRRYKDDTNSFATWLLEAAGKCGYRPTTLPSTAASHNRGKSKSKNNAVNSNPVQYSASLKDLQIFAEIIAKSSLAVPEPVLIIAKRAIKLRKEVTSWFLGQGNSDNNNKRHSHFISVLEDICDSLEWKIKKPLNPDGQGSPSTPGTSPNADIDTFMNKFAVLTVEEPEEHDPNETPSTERKELVKVEVIENVEEESDDAFVSHLFFKACCLFQDLQMMRETISQTWSDYRDLKIDLMNAAVVTDSALQIARDLVEEVVADCRTSKFSPGDKFQEFFFGIACIANGSPTTPSLEIGLPYNEHMDEVAHWCYLPTRVILGSFAEVLKVNDSPVIKKGHFGPYDAKADRQKMTLDQKFNEDKIILCELLPEFARYSALKVELPASDAITEGLMEFSKTKVVTPWICFASQILLDVHHIMRYSTLGAFADLRMTGLRIQRTITEYFKISQSHPQPKFWPKEADDEIRAVQLCVESFIIQDQVWAVLSMEMARLGKPLPEKHALFSGHAILCGVNMFHLNVRMQVLGQSLVTQWYDVQQLAFLYNLVTQYPAMKLRWPDMDTLIKIHGESQIFVGSRPKNASESLNRLELATGIASPANFARDSRRRREGSFARPNGKSARVLEPTTTIANIFRAQYMRESEEKVNSIANIEKVLERIFEESSPHATSGEIQPSNAEAMFHRRWCRTHNINTLQLLAFVKSRLFEEEPVLLFNYFGMHKRSIELLRLIKAKEHHKFVQYFTPAYMPDDSMISNIVILVHHVARGSAESARQMGIPSQFSRIVNSCGEVMQQYLQKNGDTGCKELLVFCKNKNPIRDQERVEKGETEKFEWYTLEDLVGTKAVASLMTGIPVAHAR
ncbi:hypothetical protein N7520_000505 [Penicillium odoratum]|uniref:uncharacterized protein n=1 Tax=Penicillium odoratum TaxID=1167516 RepID=UPI002547345C|nr:uncharacterized protein N7520_000505 [Penicillium odoratum]KAJ5777259.1 hypothetical protein N7520_000505 [Penicillium odoratum]